MSSRHGTLLYMDHGIPPRLTGRIAASPSYFTRATGQRENRPLLVVVSLIPLDSDLRGLSTYSVILRGGYFWETQAYHETVDLRVLN